MMRGVSLLTSLNRRTITMETQEKPKQQVRLHSLVMDSITDGLGVNLVLVFQGCKAYCPGCHNPSTHDVNGGDLFDIDDLFSYTTSLTTGVTLSGGEPLLQLDAVKYTASIAKEKGLKVTLYTGYTLERLREAFPDFMDYLNYVKCGPYVRELRSSAVPLYGSSNQQFFHITKDKLLREITGFADLDRRMVERKD